MTLGWNEIKARTVEFPKNRKLDFNEQPEKHANR